MALFHEQNPHFVMLPYMAQGHMIPMIDISRLLARRGVTVTILMTPHNYKRHKSVIVRAKESGHDINVVHIHLPYAEVGLPEGFENFEGANLFENVLRFHKLLPMLKDQVHGLLQGLKPYPSCLVADMNYPWTTEVAIGFGIPRILFHGTSCFALRCLHVLRGCKEVESAASDFEYFVVPGLPDRIEMTRFQIRGVGVFAEWEKVWDEMVVAETETFGIVVNSFEELEPEYVKACKEVKGKKVWSIGPVSLCNEDELDKIERGNKPAIDECECLKWLDSYEPSSVIYVCLGSLSTIATSQLIETGLGLKASDRPFIWVIRHAPDEFKTWLSEEKFEEKIRGRGLLIHGWASQVLILSHAAVGGFMTHCGWNSALEGITAGLPMITWPLFADQFCNGKFIVEVIKTGIPIDIEVPVLASGDEANDGVVLNEVIIRSAVEGLMDGGGEGEERRKRARRLAEMAKRAVEEGGSSHLNIELLIQDVLTQKQKHDGGSANGAALDLEKM